MQATGHRTEEASNHYVGADELPLVEEFMRSLRAAGWRSATLVRISGSSECTIFSFSDETSPFFTK